MSYFESVKLGKLKQVNLVLGLWLGKELFSFLLNLIKETYGVFWIKNNQNIHHRRPSVEFPLETPGQLLGDSSPVVSE